MRSRVIGVAAVLLGACSEPRPTPAAPARARAAPTPAVVAPVAGPGPVAPTPCSPAASAPTPELNAGEGEDRFYPGSDSARGTDPKKRYQTAVILFAPPRAPDVEPLARVETLALQPVLCTIGGRLRTGLACGEIMPKRTTVRLTSTSSGDDTMEVTRSSSPYVATPEDGTVTYPAPYAPSCCNYKRCDGKTIPYRPLERSGFAFATSKTILAVWPADADVELDPKTPETDAESKRTWTLDAMGPRKLLQLATADVDHDGKPETLVYEQWANDYGLDVFVAGTKAPLHGVHCGNI